MCICVSEEMNTSSNFNINWITGQKYSAIKKKNHKYKLCPHVILVCTFIKAIEFIFRDEIF